MKRLQLFILVALISTISACHKPPVDFTLKTEVVQVDSLTQIFPFQDTLVRPILYTHVRGLGKLPTKQSREKFIQSVLPAILVAKHNIELNRKSLLDLYYKDAWTKHDSAFYIAMKTRYKGKNIEDMLARIGTLPNSIVLAQAAVESAWGQSRFFLEGNNLFGMWSYNRYEPRIEAGSTRGKKKIYLRAYPDMSQSIEHYFDILSKSWAYKGLRKARRQTGDPYELVHHLGNFSERRGYYTKVLRQMIDNYDLKKYDKYQLDPQFFVASE